MNACYEYYYILMCVFYLVCCLKNQSVNKHLLTSTTTFLQYTITLLKQPANQSFPYCGDFSGYIFRAQVDCTAEVVGVLFEKIEYFRHLRRFSFYRIIFVSSMYLVTSSNGPACRLCFRFFISVM